jgi:hypothetical protein
MSGLNEWIVDLHVRTHITAENGPSAIRQAHTLAAKLEGTETYILDQRVRMVEAMHPETGEMTALVVREKPNV